ncbi:hypothetical protein GCM10022295_30060 [Streptomyces osmaniensis]|uniref:Uncharacterized protein n=1 Tax=Streptomyces osmaniensis TaxID=593134 RepID=A0ABP6W438_9ACTN
MPVLSGEEQGAATAADLPSRLDMLERAPGDGQLVCGAGGVLPGGTGSTVVSNAQLSLSLFALLYRDRDPVRQWP